MTESARLVQLGTVNGTPIQADVTVLGDTVAVLLSADYVLADPRPPGFPSRPAWTGLRRRTATLGARSGPEPP